MGDASASSCAVSTRHFGALGLGLYLSREIVSAHGESIEAGNEHAVGHASRSRVPA
jgi:signal transduction histidine kinase